MPIDLYTTLKDSTQHSYYIPLRMMRAEKPNPFPNIERTQEEDWPWAMPTYTFTIDANYADLQEIIIDAEQRMADVDRDDNSWSSSPSNVPKGK